MTTYVNIPTTKVESNYRYIMPKLEVQAMGKGNGFTVFTNLKAVADALNVPEKTLLKFISTEAGVAVKG